MVRGSLLHARTVAWVSTDQQPKLRRAILFGICFSCSYSGLLKPMFPPILIQISELQTRAGLSGHDQTHRPPTLESYTPFAQGSLELGVGALKVLSGVQSFSHPAPGRHATNSPMHDKLYACKTVKWRSVSGRYASQSQGADNEATHSKIHSSVTGWKGFNLRCLPRAWTYDSHQSILSLTRSRQQQRRERDEEKETFLLP